MTALPAINRHPFTLSRWLAILGLALAAALAASPPARADHDDHRGRRDSGNHSHHDYGHNSGRGGFVDPADVADRLDELAEEMRREYREELRHERRWPARGEAKSLYSGMDSLEKSASHLRDALCRRAHGREIEEELCDTRSAMNCVREHARHVRICAEVRSLIDSAEQMLCSLEGQLRGHAHASSPHRPEPPSREVTIVHQDPQPDLKEQALGLLLQALAEGLNERHSR